MRAARRLARCATAAGTASAAAAGLAILAAGTPWLMWHVTGWPLPRHVPTLAGLKADLAGQEPGRFILDVITCAGWACWAVFIGGVLLEAGWWLRQLPELARGGAGAWRTARLRDRASAVGPPRAVATVLVGGILLGLLAAVRGTSAVTAAPPGAILSTPVAAAWVTAAHGPAGPARDGDNGGPPLSAQARLPVPPGGPAGPAPPGPMRIAVERPGTVVTAADSQPAAAAAGNGSPVTRYTVREGDNLWDIALRHLGNGEKWHEIYALNAGRLQPDGQRLRLPSLIQPGWVLRLPAPGGPPAAAHAPARLHHPGRRARAPGPTGRQETRPARTPHPAPARPPDHRHGPRPASSPGISLPSGGLAGIGLAAAVTAALAIAGVQRRRRYRPARPLSSSLEPAGPPVPPVIAALRRAAWPARTAGVSGPDTGASQPDDDDDDITLAAVLQDAGTPSSGPALAGPVWPLLPSPAQPGPPGTITLGTRSGTEAAVGVTALGGLGVTGPGAPAAARAILAGLLSQGVPGSPAGPAEVIIPAADLAALIPGHLRDDTGGAGIPGLTVTASLQAALDQLEVVILGRARLSGAADMAADLLPSPAGEAGPLPAAALIATPAAPAEARLRSVLELGRGLAVTAILLGDWPHGVTCQVAADGVITASSPPAAALDGVRLFHLASTDATAILSVLQSAHGIQDSDTASTHPASSPPGPGLAVPALPASGDGRPSDTGAPIQSADRTTVSAADGGEPAPGVGGSVQPSSPPPSGAAESGAATAGRNTDPQGRPAPPAPGWAGRPGALPPGSHRTATTAAVQVDVLGPLRITAHGQEIHGGLRKARELLAFLVLHPDGATGEAISEALWPESAPGYGTSQRNTALRKLRDMLRAATGLTEPMFVILASERYRLDPGLLTADAWQFHAALEAARAAAGDDARLAACQEAAALYRGPLADGAGYDWAEPYAEQARRRALDAYTRIAEILAPRDPEQALAALETALTHDPYNEFVYQKIMRMQSAAGRPDAVRRTLRLLEARLAELGITPGAQTRQAAAALLGPASPAPAATAGQPDGHGSGPQAPARPGRNTAR